MVQLAEKNKNIQYLVFTKKHHYDYSSRPKNLQVILSMWQGITIPKNPNNLPLAWVKDGIETRIPKNAIECRDKCETCRKCWNLSELKKDVYFNIH